MKTTKLYRTIADVEAASKFDPAPGLRILNADLVKKIDTLLAYIADTTGHGRLTLEIHEGHLKIGELSLKIRMH